MRPTAAVILLASCPLVAASALAGPLDPPPGPVSPAYKTLTEVEPRIAINATNTPGDADSVYRIAAPGSYYLTGPVTGESGKSGIEVAAAGVTIDLSGFALQGVAGSLNGLVIPQHSDEVTLRSGIIRGWGAYGVAAASAKSGRFEDLTITENGVVGLKAGTGSMLSRVVATDNGHTGIEAGPVCTLTGCIATGNGSFGFSLGSDTTVRDCAARYNTNTGFSFGAALVRCTSTGNLNGFVGAGVYESCAADDNQVNGFYLTGSSVVSGCQADRNGQHGIAVIGPGSRVAGNTCTNSGMATGVSDGAGIFVGDGARNSTLEGNTCADNERGMTVQATHCRIEANHLADNTAIGLLVTGQYNIIIRNTARNTAGVNWNIVAGNRGGVFVGPPLGGSVIGASGGAGSGTTDPFANLSF